MVAIFDHESKNPETKQWVFLFDKCLPFGTAISCTIFQQLSNVLTYITKFKLKNLVPQFNISNNLDDFLKIAISRADCNLMLTMFHAFCEELGVPLAKEKTVWTSLLTVFLGILLDGQNYLLALPDEKIAKAKMWLEVTVDHEKIKVKDVQKLTGLLNFLNKAIVLRRAFTHVCQDQWENQKFATTPSHLFRQRIQGWLSNLVEITKRREFGSNILPLFRPGRIDHSSRCWILHWQFGKWKTGFWWHFQYKMVL